MGLSIVVVDGVLGASFSAAAVTSSAAALSLFVSFCFPGLNPTLIPTPMGMTSAVVLDAAARPMAPGTGRRTYFAHSVCISGSEMNEAISAVGA